MQPHAGTDLRAVPTAVIVYVVVLILMIKVFVPGQFLNGIDDVRSPASAPVSNPEQIREEFEL